MINNKEYEKEYKTSLKKAEAEYLELEREYRRIKIQYTREEAQYNRAKAFLGMLIKNLKGEK